MNDFRPNIPLEYELIISLGNTKEVESGIQFHIFTYIQGKTSGKKPLN